MTRPRRLDPEMGIHHVYTRGSKRWTIFHDDADRRRFMGLLSKVCDRYGVAVLAFALMDNHVHIVLRCPQGGLSNALRDLKSAYAKWFNARHRSSGPLFEGRFGSKLVTSHHQLRALVRYVHRNPYSVDAHMNLVAYPWSSHGMYAGVRGAPVWLDRSVVLPMFSDYRSEVERPLPTDAVQNAWYVAIPSESMPGTNSLTGATVSVSEILIAVAHAAGVPVADVHPSKRNGLIGIALVLALDEAGFEPAEVAEPLGYRTYKAVTSARRRACTRLAGDAYLADVLQRARNRFHRTAA